MESSRRNGLATYVNIGVFIFGGIIEVIRLLNDVGVEAHAITAFAYVGSGLMTYLKRGQAIEEIKAQGFQFAPDMIDDIPDAITEANYGEYDEAPDAPTDLQP